MSKKITVSLIIALCFCAVTATAMELNTSLEASFMSKYMWHGFEVYGSKSASSLDFTVELDDTGFYFGAQYIMPNAGGSMNSRYFKEEQPDPQSISRLEKFIYYGGYQMSLFDADVFKTDLDLRYQYHDYHRMSRSVLNHHEASLYAQWQELLPQGLTPYYQATYITNAKSGTRRSLELSPGFPPVWNYEGSDRNSHVKGWLHKVGLALDVPFDLPEIGMDSVRFTIDTVYNDGIVSTRDITRGGGSEWTHLTYGAQTSLDMGPGSLCLGVYYQHAFADDYVHLGHTFYSAAAYKFEF